MKPSALVRALLLSLALAGCAAAPVGRRAVLPFGAFHNDQGMVICPGCGRGDYKCTKAGPDAHIDAVHLDYVCSCGEEWSTATLTTVPTFDQLSAWLSGQQQQAAQQQHDAELAAKVKAETLAELKAAQASATKPAESAPAPKKAEVPAKKKAPPPDWKGAPAVKGKP